MPLPVLDLSKQNSTHAFIKQIYFKLFGITDASPNGSDRTGVCGGCKPVAASADAFDYPSWIRNTGADCTIGYTDEYGNIVAGYPLKSGEATDFRISKLTATTGTGLYRIYSK